MLQIMMGKFKSSLVNLTLKNKWPFHSYKVYSVVPKTNQHLDYLLSLQQQERYDFWSELRKLDFPISVMVSPEEENKFVNLMETQQIFYELLIPNVEV